MLFFSQWSEIKADPKRRFYLNLYGRVEKRLDSEGLLTSVWSASRMLPKSTPLFTRPQYHRYTDADSVRHSMLPTGSPSLLSRQCLPHPHTHCDCAFASSFSCGGSQMAMLRAPSSCMHSNVNDKSAAVGDVVAARPW